ncbi:ricin-type beta-trefoil lectin domain protein [Kitasatospora sp. NPDC059747]|uniref:ricin-type beta-trefoil lectin domain protein n=1 Tax=Kitasatospora sp. NPDC059747 TaxID=3346930 RepID=UPI003663FE68
MTAVLALTTALAGPQAPAIADSPQAPSQAAIDAATAKMTQERPPANATETAIAQAKATGKNVPIDSLTTEFSETVATPAGHLALTSHPDQQRVKRNGVWQGLDATLVANQDGTFSPKSAAGQLTLSKGGNGPLATMTSADGKKLALTAPFALTTPTVTGDSVVYPSVGPDIDLKVTATKLGGLSTVLVVKTQAAAANPVLKNLHFDTTADGVTVSSDAKGNITATAADGKPRWTARTPQMWDSTPTSAAPTPSSAPAVKASMMLMAAPAADTPAPTGTPTDPAKAAPAGSDAGPGAGSKVSDMPVKAGATGIDLTPDQDLLAHGTAPYYIDPAFLPWSTSANAWTWVQSQHDGSNNWLAQGSKDSDHPGVGVCGTYPNGGSCIPADIERSFYQFDTSALSGTVVHYATMNLQEYVSADFNCSTAYNLNLYVTGAIANGTTWSNQPSATSGSFGPVAVGGSGHNGCYDNVPFAFTVTAALQQYTNSGQLTFGLYGDESNQYAFKRFTYQPSLYVEYDRIPNTPTNPAVWPAPTTVVPGGANQSCGDGNANHWAWLGAGTNQDNKVFLNATVASNAQSQLYSWDHIWDYNLPGVPDVASGYSNIVGSGGTTTFQVPGRVIQDGHAYGFSMRATDQLDGVPWSDTAPNCYFKVDLTPPTLTFPTTVSDTTKQFPPSGNGQTPQIYAGQSGGVPFTATDPAPSGGYSSGLACLRWSFDPQLAGASWQCGSSMPSGQIPVTAGRWGTNVLYIQAEDNAGNISPVAQYAFYAPWNPNSPAPVFGDVTGDALPDIVTADPNGDLRAYNIGASTTAPKSTLLAPKTLSPHSDSWAAYHVTHRGSLRGGLNVDDVIAHRDNDTDLWYSANPGNSGVAGVLGTAKTVLRPTCDATLPDCTDYAADWSKVLQIAASGDPTTTNLDPSKKFLNRTGLFTVESTAGGTDAALWFYPTVGQAVFGSPTKLDTKGWKGWDLISPGDWKGQGHPGLWARNQSTGELRACTFTVGTINGVNQYGDSVTYSSITSMDPPTTINGPGGLVSTGWPTVGSDGDLTNSGSPTLWGITPTGVIQIWTGHSTTTAPYFTWTAGPTTVSNTYADNTSVTLAAQSGKCMDVNGASSAPGAAVQIWDCNTTNAQWSFKPDGTLRVLGGCLDATQNGTANGTALELWTCGNGSPNQIFLPRSDGTLYNPASGRCVDLPYANTTNGTRLQLFDCNGGTAQKWAPVPRSS